MPKIHKLKNVFLAYKSEVFHVLGFGIFKSFFETFSDVFKSNLKEKWEKI